MPTAFRSGTLVPVFDRFSDRARKTLGLARQVAQRYNHDYIGTEHILLGLLVEDTGSAIGALDHLGIDRRALSQAVDSRIESGIAMVTMGQLPFTPRAKRVLELAYEECTELGHESIGAGHLLLGLVREQDGIAGRVLEDAGVRIDELRDFVASSPESGVTQRRAKTAGLSRKLRNPSVRLDGLDDERVPEGVRGAVLEATRRLDLVRDPDGLADLVITFAPEESSDRMFRAGFAAAWKECLVVLVHPGEELPPPLENLATALVMDDALEERLASLVETLR